MALNFITLCFNRTLNTPVGHERLGQPFWPNSRSSPSSCSREHPGCKRLAQLTGVNGCSVIFQQVPVSKTADSITITSAVVCFHSRVLNFYFLFIAVTPGGLHGHHSQKGYQHLVITHLYTKNIK